MNTRIANALLALGALLLFYVIFLRGGGVAPPSVSLPVSIEDSGNGYLAAGLALERAGVRVESWRSAFSALGNQAGNLLIVTVPGERQFASDDLAALDRWLRAGNTLLVVAPLLDRPDWAVGAAPAAISYQLKALTGLDFEWETDPGDAQRARLQVVPTGALRLLKDIERLDSAAPASSGRWELRIPYQQFALEIARDTAAGRGALWTRIRGDGVIHLLGLAGSLANSSLASADNAQLLSNLVALAVAPGGRVLFDDGHQGLAERYDPEQFYADPRFRQTIVVMLIMWLTWVLGATSLKSAVARRGVAGRSAPGRSAPGEVDLLLASGGFLARVVPPQLAAERMLRRFWKRVATRLGVEAGTAAPSGEAMLERLARHPRVDAADLQRLRRYHSRGAKQPGSLRGLHNLLLKMERQLR